MYKVVKASHIPTYRDGGIAAEYRPKYKELCDEIKQLVQESTHGDGDFAQVSEQVNQQLDSYDLNILWAGRRVTVDEARNYANTLLAICDKCEQFKSEYPQLFED